MGRLIETVGKYTNSPYYVTQAGTMVYCVEELCFVLCRNAFLLDRRILDPELVRWLDMECGLPKLARELNQMIYQKASPSAFVCAILKYVSYGSEKERLEVEEMLRKSADMDASARRKVFVDNMTERRKFSQAVREYDRIFEEIPPMDHVMRAEILHNKGVALCRLFSFEEASEAFLEACKEDPGNRELEIHYLMALRMGLSEEDYIAVIADHKNWYEASLEVEKRMEESRMEFELSGGEEIFHMKSGREDIGYYEEMAKTVASMKDEYREMVAGA